MDRLRAKISPPPYSVFICLLNPSTAVNTVHRTTPDCISDLSSGSVAHGFIWFLIGGLLPVRLGSSLGTCLYESTSCDVPDYASGSD